MRSSSAASFFSGWRSTPGTMPATSQLDRLISITAISVLSGSRATRDRSDHSTLHGALHRSHISDDGCNILAAAPIASSLNSP